MGNQCHENNTTQTKFIDFKNQKDKLFELRSKQTKNTINQCLNKFKLENQGFFKNIYGRNILSCLGQQNLQNYITKFPFKYIVQQKVIWLNQPNNINIKTYEGNAMILDNLNQIFYVGQIKALQKQGKGILIDRRGNFYQGNLQHDFINGQGELVLLYPKRRYKGFWVNRKLQGSGQVFYEDGAYYKGQLLEGKKQKYGMLKFQDGSVYKGYFKADLMHGQGILIKFKGIQIHGEWKQGRFKNAIIERSSHTGSINQLSSN